ncbi:putative signal peptide protein [Puccinia sorghi]|uniref:Putative signal peptide protein n=1 Tax=Puccinia sorghi TaxID=27349 RepID=A0A0L6UG27_9BASI|nr:putative signal peptide protein [Puccinia sorghi]
MLHLNNCLTTISGISLVLQLIEEREREDAPRKYIRAPRWEPWNDDRIPCIRFGEIFLLSTPL